MQFRIHKCTFPYIGVCLNAALNQRCSLFACASFMKSLAGGTTRVKPSAQQ
jgi:hypothetical protein